MKNKNLILYGMHAVAASLRTRPDNVVSVSVYEKRGDKRIQQILELARMQNVPVHLLSKFELVRLMPDANHQGVIAEIKSLVSYREADIKPLLENSESALVLILDGVQDPHNLGACLRTADAAGVSLVIAPKDNAVGINATVSKVACGAAETVPYVQVTNLARTIKLLKDCHFWIYGADGEAQQSLYQLAFSGNIAIVLGAEGKGLRRLTRESCDALMRIPMTGSVESLNVSVATGICLFEAVRQR